MKKIAHQFYQLLPLLLITSILFRPDLTYAAGNADNFIFTGSATSSYTIEVPPGRSGVAPQLTLSYNSMGRNGWLGIGWDLSMGYIIRNTKYGIPSYNDSTDQFALNLKGATYEIVPIGGNEYRLKIESEFLRIIKEADNSWTVKDKGGTTYKFGSTGASQITNSKGTFQWNLDRVEDLDGNYMTISYTPDQGQLYLSQIQYAGNSNTGDAPLNTVTFYLENRSDSLRGYNSGDLITTAKRLDYVETNANGANVLRYTFDYDESPISSRSRLSAVRKYGWNGSWVQFPAATTFTYATDSVSYSTSTTMTGSPDVELRLIDMNRDSLPDAVQFEGGYLKYYYPNQGDGVLGSRITITNPPSSSSVEFLFDMNNDGLPDVFYNGGYYPNNGDGSFGNFISMTFPTGFPSIANSNYVDMNGDGLVDVLYGDYSEWRYYPNLGNGSFGDAINVPNPPSSGCCPISLSQVDGWQFADLNGDGLLDFVYTSSVGTTILAYWRNVGGDFASGAGITSSSTLPDKKYLQCIDMNGDGLADAVNVKANDYKYWPNLGNDTFGNVISLPGPDKDNDTAPGVQFLDIDGDGMTDVLSGKANNYQYWRLQPGDNTLPNFLIHVDNGIGGTTDIAYKSSTYYDNTGSDSIPDFGMTFQFVDSITNNDGMGNSYTINYDYEGVVYDAANREYLGVRKVTTTRADGNYTEAYFRQDGVGSEYIYKGKPEFIKEYDSSGNLLSESSTTWEYVDTAGGGKFSRVRETIARLYDTQGDYTETVTTNQGYDSYGNVTQVKVSTADGLTRYTKTQYINDTTNWVFVPEIIYVTAGDPAADTNYLRWTQLFYNEDGLNRYHLNRIRSLKDISPLTYVDSTITYDAYGNTDIVTDAENRWAKTSYDSTFHQFPVTMENQLSHTVTTTYNPGFGSALTTTDSSGSTAKTDYDEFGRAIASYLPDPNGNPTILAKEIQYTNYTDSANPNRLYTKTYVGDGTILEEYVYSDGLGRTLETKNTGKAGELVGAKPEYDNLGRVWRRSTPYSSPTSTYLSGSTAITDWTTSSYDAWGRIDSTTAPDGSLSTINFDIMNSQMQVTLKDPNYNASEPWRGKKVTLTDGFGRKIRVEEYNVDTLYATTYYEYYLTGELKKLTDNAGNISTMAYDRLGWKLTMNDPDKGNVVYEYDDVGSLRFQTDNKGQQIEFQYDVLGRIKKKISTEGTTDYTYDEPATGYYQTGRLTTVNAPGITTKFYYDSMGMSIKTEKIVGGTTYAVLSSYDNLGRESTITYPDGEVVTNTYDGSYLKTMSGDSAYISDMDYNINGQAIAKSYGNGVQFTYDYFPQNFRLKQILSQRGTTTLQNLQFGYDKVGNIKSITDYAPNHANNQGYIYDHLYRLTRYDLNGQTGTRSYQYNTIGNMTYNSNLGSYAYGQNGAGPHAVTTAGNLSYTYDGNGNMETGDGRTLTYDSQDRVSSAVKEGNVVNFAYDQDGDRIKKRTITTITNLASSITLITETIYLGDLYEIEKVNGYVSKITKHYHLGIDKVASREVVRTVSTLFFYHGDQIGSSNIITDDAGYEIQHIEYYPFGEIRTNENSNGSTIDVPYKFTGQELDTETGLYYYGARYYDAKLCRFISADDIVQAPFNPQSLNRYSYTLNNPVILIDPTGNSSDSFNNDWNSMMNDIDSTLNDMSSISLFDMWGSTNDNGSYANYNLNDSFSDNLSSNLNNYNWSSANFGLGGSGITGGNITSNPYAAKEYQRILDEGYVLKGMQDGLPVFGSPASSAPSPDISGTILAGDPVIADTGNNSGFPKYSNWEHFSGKENIVKGITEIMEPFGLKAKHLFKVLNPDYMEMVGYNSDINLMMVQLTTKLKSSVVGLGKIMTKGDFVYAQFSRKSIQFFGHVGASLIGSNEVADLYKMNYLGFGGYSATKPDGDYITPYVHIKLIGQAKPY